MSIDQLVELEGQVFDSHGENSDEYKLVAKILDAKETKYIEAKERADKEAAEKKAKMEQFRIEIKQKLEGSSIRKMDAVYQAFGDQYINDYVVDEQQFIIKSLVARENQNDMWHLDDIDSLNRKLKNLIYDRVYDNYIRRGSYGMLQHFYEEVFYRIHTMDHLDKEA